MDKVSIEKLNEKFKDSSPFEIIEYFSKNYANKIALASSLGLEDQVITDMIASVDKSVKIFTLDTGRLFPQTYKLIDQTNKKYDLKIQIYFPDATKVEEMVNTKGINLFYNSIEERKLCCNIRKIQPLTRAFENLDVWICGLRKEQSITRQDLQIVEWDTNNNLLKINPLINWTETQVWDYINQNEVPYNSLHDESYPSIGCEPCTKAVKAGDDIRSGRWWWEAPEHKECGLHSKDDTKPLFKIKTIDN